MNLGYVLIEWNQASKQPRIDGDLCDSLDEADELKAYAEKETLARHRGETYSIARVVLDEPR